MSLTDNRTVMLGKDLLRPFLDWISGFFVPYKIVIRRPAHFLSDDRPAIYAVNHFCFADTPIMGKAVPERSYILLGRQRAESFRPSLFLSSWRCLC